MTTKHTEPTDTRCQLRFADGRRCALPVHPDGDGLCYPHAHAPHRRLRPSDLIRELSPSNDALIPTHKLRRILTKLPIAVSEGLFTRREAGALIVLCNLILGCNREARTNLRLKPTTTNWKSLSAPLAEDAGEASPPPAKN